MYTEEENLESIQLLQRDLTHFMEKNEIQHDNIIEKLEVLNDQFKLKHKECENRFDAIEANHEKLKDDYYEYKASNSGKWSGVSVVIVVVAGILNLILLGYEIFF